MIFNERTLLKRLEALGHGVFYVTLYLFGHFGAYVLLVPVIFTYVLFSRHIHQLTIPYRSRRFTGRGWLQSICDTFHIVHSFGRVLVDRGWLGIKKGSRLYGNLVGKEELLDAVGQGKGLVLLTAHVGNWQTAFSHITELGVPVNSLMQYEQEAVAKHYFDLRNEPCPFTIIRSDGFLGGMVEATTALQNGEVVTIMGDRYTKGPHASVTFLGSQVRLPSAAYSLAAATGSPVAILLAVKTSRKNYVLRVWDIFSPQHGERAGRRNELGQWAGRFARALEEYVRQYPYQWYNFYDFWKQ